MPCVRVHTKSKALCCQGLLIFWFVGLPGIEPGLHEPESCVLPAYASPVIGNNLLVVLANFHDPASRFCLLTKHRSGAHKQAKSEEVRFLLACALRKNRTCDLSRVRRTL